MAFRKRRRSKRMYFRKRGMRRIGRRRTSRKKLSQKRFKQWWPDLLYTKLKASVPGNYWVDQVVQTVPMMSNPESSFGPNNQYSTTGQAQQLFHAWLLNPDMYSTQPSLLGNSVVLRTSPSAVQNFPYNAVFPDMKTTALRYIAYRVMGVKITMTFRCSDLTAGENPGSWPYFITGLPFQSDDTTLGNYWNGQSQTTVNNTLANLTFSDVANLPHGFHRKVKGQGAKNGGVKTISFMMYPWKVYGMTRSQWMVDPKARMIINDVNAGTRDPFLVIALADYNPTTQRTYSFDWTYTTYLRWEGQKFLQPEQA